MLCLTMCALWTQSVNVKTSWYLSALILNTCERLLLVLISHDVVSNVKSANFRQMVGFLSKSRVTLIRKCVNSDKQEASILIETGVKGRWNLFIHDIYHSEEGCISCLSIVCVCVHCELSKCVNFVVVRLINSKYVWTSLVYLCTACLLTVSSRVLQKVFIATKKEKDSYANLLTWTAGSPQTISIQFCPLSTLLPCPCRCSWMTLTQMTMTQIYHTTQ